MIKLIYGPMRSGKSATLIDAIEDAQSKNKSIRCYKPKMDTRSEYIKSRNGKKIECLSVSSFASIYDDAIKTKGLEIIFIDEVQFLKPDGLKILIKFALSNNIDVIASGLNLTSEFEIFETTSRYAMYCEEMEHIKGKCEVCGSEDSMFSRCNSEKNGAVLIGDEIYSQTCFKCFNS